MPLRIRSHITYPQKPKPVKVEHKPRGVTVHFVPWDAREDAVLIEFYKELGPTKIAERLGRTPGAVTQRYLKINGEDARTCKKWDDREKMIIRRYYRDLGSKAVAEMLPGRDYRAVQNCARAMGITVRV